MPQFSIFTGKITLVTSVGSVNMTDVLAKLYEQGIAKKLLYCGKGELPEYGDGTKV